jgi:hypothetical protein
MLSNFKMPKKFSYPAKNITVTAEVRPNAPGDSGEFTRQIKRKIINRATELAGVIPFDWYYSPEIDQFVVFFGFDLIEPALAAQQRLQDSNFHSHLWDEAMQNQMIGKIMRQSKAEGYETSMTDAERRPTGSFFSEGFLCCCR